jgi:hypothetical protein
MRPNAVTYLRAGQIADYEQLIIVPTERVSAYRSTSFERSVYHNRFGICGSWIASLAWLMWTIQPACRETPTRGLGGG